MIATISQWVMSVQTVARADTMRLAGDERVHRELSAEAAVTTRLELATGVCLSEHRPRDCGSTNGLK